MTHTDACNAAIFQIQRLGGRAWRRDVGLFWDARGNLRRVGVPGEADVQGILPGGRAIAVEVKTGHAKRTARQCRWAECFQSLGGVYCVARYSETGRNDGDETIRRVIEESREWT